MFETIIFSWILENYDIAPPEGLLRFRRWKCIGTTQSLFFDHDLSQQGFRFQAHHLHPEETNASKLRTIFWSADVSSSRGLQVINVPCHFRLRLFCPLHFQWITIQPWFYPEFNPESLTLWLFNIAIENGPFIDDFPSYKPPFSSGILHGYVK